MVFSNFWRFERYRYHQSLRVPQDFEKYAGDRKTVETESNF